MQTELATLEKEGLDAMNAGKKREAIALFTKIVEQRPDYEHGMVWHDLAGCYEDLGELEEAERCYLRALEYGTGDSTIHGGYASFLFLHGDPQKAFDAHLELLKLDRSCGDMQGEEKSMWALKELAKKLGLSDEALSERINAALTTST